MEPKKLLIHKKSSPKIAHKTITTSRGQASASPAAPTANPAAEAPPLFIPKASQPIQPSAPQPVHDNSNELADLYRAELDALKDQMFAYQELGFALMTTDWTADTIIESLMVLTRTLLYDAVALVLLDDDGKSLAAPALRGFHYRPSPQISVFWSKAHSSKMGLDWELILDSVCDPTPVSGWLAAERFCSCGLIPVQDDKRIYGFILIGSRELHATDDFSMAILRLSAQRIAQSLAFRALKQQSGTASPAPAPTPVAEAKVVVPPQLAEVKAKLSFATDLAHLLRNAAQMPADRVALTAADCAEATKAAADLLGQILDESK